MMTTVALAAALAGVWLAASDRENNSRAMVLPDRVLTLFPDPQPLTAFALTDLAGQLGAAYQVAFTPGMENYPVYHSTTVILVDPRARYHAAFTPPLDAETISRRFKVLREIAGAKAA